jgi:hypothetical protein
MWGPHNSTSTAFEHTLELVLDYYDVGNVAGVIKIKYCEFDDAFCGCDWDISPGDGLFLQSDGSGSGSESGSASSEPLEWGAAGRCISPEDLRSDGESMGLYVSMTQRETEGLLGDAALAAEITAPRPQFRSTLNFTMRSQDALATPGMETTLLTVRSDSFRQRR